VETQRVAQLLQAIHVDADCVVIIVVVAVNVAIAVAGSLIVMQIVETLLIVVDDVAALMLVVARCNLCIVSHGATRMAHQERHRGSAKCLAHLSHGVKVGSSLVMTSVAMTDLCNMRTFVPFLSTCDGGANSSLTFSFTGANGIKYIVHTRYHVLATFLSCDPRPYTRSECTGWTTKSSVGVSLVLLWTPSRRGQP
jgi:hypothetical protein